jgi:hypothetical protein
MKCFNHQSNDAIAICAYCGRALCQECITTEARRITCSPDCAAKLSLQSESLQMLVDKSGESAKANAFYCYLTGGLSAAAAIAAWFMLPSPFLIYFTGGCALALFAAGFWHGRVARTQMTKE